MSEPILNAEELNELGEIIGMDGLSELVEVFVGDTAPQLQAIADAVAGGDPQSIRHAAHSYKGAASGVGAVRVAALARAMEDGARVGDTSQATDLLAGLRTETELAVSELRAFVKAA